MPSARTDAAVNSRRAARVIRLSQPRIICCTSGRTRPFARCVSASNTAQLICQADASSLGRTSPSATSDLSVSVRNSGCPSVSANSQWRLPVDTPQPATHILPCAPQTGSWSAVRTLVLPVARSALCECAERVRSAKASIPIAGFGGQILLALARNGVRLALSYFLLCRLHQAPMRTSLKAEKSIGNALTFDSAHY